MKLIENTVNVMTTVIIACAVIIFGPMIFGLRPYVVLSGSMSPVIRTGALAYVNTKADPDSLCAGEIAAFRLGDNTVSHRIVREEGDAFVTKGDANSCEDEFRVKKTDIVGKTVYSIPLLGYVLDRVKISYVVFAVIFLTCIYCVTVLSDNIYQKRRKGGIENEKNN